MKTMKVINLPPASYLSSFPAVSLSRHRSSSAPVPSEADTTLLSFKKINKNLDTEADILFFITRHKYFW